MRLSSDLREFLGLLNSAGVEYVIRDAFTRAKAGDAGSVGRDRGTADAFQTEKIVNRRRCGLRRDAAGRNASRTTAHRLLARGLMLIEWSVTLKGKGAAP